MGADVYQKLAKHLDRLPAGFPKTGSGVELRILRRLFTQEDAELALYLTLIPEEPRVIARRARITVEEAARRLEELDKKGLILGIRRKGEPPLYMAQQFVVGFWEAQVNTLDRELVQDFEEYLPTLFDLNSWRKAPQLRTIPVNKSISVRNEVMPYEQAEELVRAKESFAVSNCICRQEHHILGKGCDKPVESCLTLGMAAESVVRTGRGRAISREEALEILHRAEKAGLVLQPANAKDPLFICTCCGCCCGVLRSLKRDRKPASLVSSPFLAHLATETCKGCGACVKRCQMDAVSMNEEKAVPNLDRCIGCGLCVSTCPTNSISLVRKAEQSYVPKDIIETSIKMMKTRGKIRMVKLVGMQVRSKLDRLLAPK
ncbi:MAG TPA: 4Fe-4S dicluster domain-containing protein [Syntrophorhabdales bacterium]|nr:4Fe-4S dicluster domain-containing protein [Syntrophorhabdales bacterium]